MYTITKDCINTITNFIIDYLSKRRFVRSVLVLAGGTAFAQALTILISPIITRLYSPQDFGVLAVYVSLLAILGGISSLNYENAIPIADDDESAVNVVALSCIILFATGFLIVFFLFFFGDYLIGWTNTPAIKPFLALLPLGILGVGLYQILSNWAVRKRHFKLIARAKINQSIGKSAIQLGGALIFPGLIWLILGQMIGVAGGTINLFRYFYTNNKNFIKNIKISNLSSTAYRFKRFPLFSNGAFFLNSLNLQLPNLLLAAFYGPRVAGLYMLGQSVLGLPLNLIGNSLAEVFFGEAAHYSKQSLEHIKRLFIRVTWSMFLLGLPIVGLSLLAPLYFPVVFGREWIEAGTYVQIFSVAFLLRFCAVPIGGIYLVLERQDLHVVREAIRTLMIFVSLWLANFLEKDALTALLWLAIAFSVGYLVYILLAWYAIVKVSNKKE